jgi:plasmid stability protein
MNLSIKNVADDLVAQLRLRARRNHRSLQGEMLAIIEEALQGGDRLAEGEVLADAEMRQASGFSEHAGTAAGLHDEHQVFRGRSGSLSDSDWAGRLDARDRAVDRALDLMQRGLSFGGQRFTRDEMHQR